MAGIMMVSQKLYDRQSVMVLLTYCLVFLINLLYEIISMGGVAALTITAFADSIVRALFITLVLLAGDAGVKWKQEGG